MNTLNETLVSLLAGGAYRTGEELGARLGVSRAAVWKQIESLRGLGIAIESAGKRGYRMIPPDDPLFPPLLGVPGCVVEYHYEIRSTNARAAELAEQGAAEGTLALAEIQTGGKGRRGHEWSSPLGGLWCSLILRPRRPPADAQRAPLIAAVAAAQACEDVTGLRPGVKWPNDLVLNGRKLCGILLETSVEAERVRHMVMGIGINVSQRREDFPDALRDSVTSLSIESGAAVKRGEVLRAFADRFWGWYRGLESGGGEFFREAFMPEYASRSVTLGREVSVAADAQTYAARAEAIGESGELIVRADDGAVRSVWAADVSVR